MREKFMIRSRSFVTNLLIMSLLTLSIFGPVVSRTSLANPAATLRGVVVEFGGLSGDSVVAK